LLRLLAQGRISEFHTELEAIGSQHLKNIYISHPIAIEQALMEGSYNKVGENTLAPDSENCPSHSYSIRFYSFRSGELELTSLLKNTHSLWIF
jgi:hypothetical protein